MRKKKLRIATNIPQIENKQKKTKKKDTDLEKTHKC